MSVVDSHFLSWLRIVSEVVNYTSEFVSRTQENFPWKKHFLFECQCLQLESTNWGHYFYVSNCRRDRHFTWSADPREGKQGKRSTFISQLLYDLQY